MRHVTIMDVPFLNTTQDAFVELLSERAQEKEKTFVITANPEIVMQANKHTDFMRYIEQADYITADGIGVVKAAEILGNPLPERVTGYDTMVKLLEVSNEEKLKIYLLGAEQATLDRAILNINATYPHVEIVGSHNGFFDWESGDIQDEIKQTEPDFVFVALGVPRQEKWIADNIDQFDHGIFIGVGGSFDVIAGTVKRAPDFWVNLNLEWFYRLMKQPSRFGRMLVLPHFAMKIFGMKLRGDTET